MFVGAFCDIWLTVDSELSFHCVRTHLFSAKPFGIIVHIFEVILHLGKSINHLIDISRTNLEFPICRDGTRELGIQIPLICHRGTRTLMP
jgi:hypothetical protein